MFGLFKAKAKGAIQDYREQAESLGVFTLALTHVDDPFDADPLWDRKYGGNNRIAEEKTGDRDFRLQTALDGLRDVKFVRDDQGRYREQTPVFTDVVVWLPEAKYRADANHKGVRIEALAANLADLHERKFSRSLPPGRAPNYTIMPDSELAPNAVAFQFGFGVYVPGPDDELLGSIALKRAKDDKPLPLPEWSFWRKGAQVKRPVGVYSGQGAILIVPDRSAPIRSPLWFGKRDGHLTVNLSAHESERVDHSVDQVKIVETVQPKRDGEPYLWVLKDERGAEKSGEDSLVVEVRFVSEPATQRAFNVPPPPPPPPPPPKAAPKVPPRPVVPVADPPTVAPRDIASRGQSAPPSAKPGMGRFFPKGIGAQPAPPPPISQRPTGPGDAPAPRAMPQLSSRYSLKLTGCALLRIDGERKLGGLEEWAMWFDRNGRLLRKDDTGIDTEKCLALAATASAAHLFYRLPGEAGFSPVKHMPCALDTGGGRFLELYPSPEPEAYHGLLMLRQETTLPLSASALLLGRSDAQAEAAQPDLPLEMLDHPRNLRWADGKGPKGAKLNALNLSRRHVSLRLVGGKLELGMAEGKMPVYVLDREARLMRAIQPGDRKTALLEPDELFVVGNYLLRYHEEKPQAFTGQATVLRARSRKAG